MLPPYIQIGFSKQMTAAVFALLEVVYSETYTILQPSYFLSSWLTESSLEVLTDTHLVILLDPGSPDSRICDVTLAPEQPVKKRIDATSKNHFICVLLWVLLEREVENGKTDFEPIFELTLISILLHLVG